MAISRMSPMNITNDFVRARFYREIAAGNSSWDEWEIAEGEHVLPELISFRYYSTPAMKMIVVVAGGLDDPTKSFRVGSSMRLPPARWIRDRIRYYSDLEKKINYAEEVLPVKSAVSSSGATNSFSTLLPSETVLLEI